MEEETNYTEESPREELSSSLRDILLALGYKPEDFDPNALTIGELMEMVKMGAFGPNGIVISGDHGGPIPAE